MNVISVHIYHPRLPFSKAKMFYDSKYGYYTLKKEVATQNILQFREAQLRVIKTHLSLTLSRKTAPLQRSMLPRKATRQNGDKFSARAVGRTPGRGEMGSQGPSLCDSFPTCIRERGATSLHNWRGRSQQRQRSRRKGHPLALKEKRKNLPGQKKQEEEDGGEESTWQKA